MRLPQHPAHGVSSPSPGIKSLAATDFAAAAGLKEWVQPTRETDNVKHNNGRVASSVDGAGLDGSVRFKWQERR
jgi:hypothetical protein